MIRNGGIKNDYLVELFYFDQSSSEYFCYINNDYGIVIKIIINKCITLCFRIQIDELKVRQTFDQNKDGVVSDDECKVNALNIKA